MKKILVVTLMVLLAVASLALAAGVGDLAWNESNIATLRAFDKSAVLGFINQWGGFEGPDAIPAKQVWQYKWVDLAGDGKYQLALEESAGPCCVFLAIYWQDAPGKIRAQTFAGGGGLNKAIRDLNGDGKDELILSKLVVAHNDTSKAYWPAIYRLENGKYVEASRDFPKFYDDEVLPHLDKQIDKNQAKVAAGLRSPDALADLIMEKDKILRTLSRDPTEGLQQAYQWMNSDDPDLLQNAAVTFKEIGGHEAEARAADEAATRALCKLHPQWAMCKNAPARQRAGSGQ